MKITIKTLQQKQFQVEAEPTDTILDLKTKIQAQQNHPVESQKLIFSGKVLQDGLAVGTFNIKEKDFLVLMVAKPKPTSAAAASTSAQPAAAVPAPSEPAAPTPAPVEPTPPPPAAAAGAPAVPAAAEPTPQAPATTAPTEPPAERAFGDMTSFLSGGQLQSSIDNMVEMGFPRDQVLLAMRASFNNPDRAVEYLMNGIPAHLVQQQQQQQQAADAAPAAPAAANPAEVAAPAPAAPAPATAAPQNLFQLAQQQAQGAGGAALPPLGGGGAPPGAGAAVLQQLRNQPQFAQIRQLVAQNPALVQPLIQQLAAANPGLGRLLQERPEVLAEILEGIGAGEGEDDGEGELPGHVLAITPEQDAAIRRLEALGFSRQHAAEAYFACDMNEDLAANFLFEGAFED